MPVPARDADHLIALIESARQEARRVGCVREVEASLDQALAAARALGARGGRPDEGIRPENLTTENDE